MNFQIFFLASVVFFLLCPRAVLFHSCDLFDYNTYSPLSGKRVWFEYRVMCIAKTEDKKDVG